MKLLDQYIAKSIFTGTLIALFALTALDVFFALVGELDDIGKGSYQIEDVFLFILFTLPRRLYEYFPAAILVGSLLSLGAMAANSELIAMRAAGVSIKRIVRSAVQAACILMLLIALIGEYWVPPSEQYAQNLRYQKQTNNISLTGDSGVWIKDKSFFINIGKVYPNNILEDVTLYELDQQRRIKQITMAKSAIRMRDHWLLQKVDKKAFSDKSVSFQQAAHERRYDMVQSNLLTIVNVDPVNMSARDLYDYVEYLQDNDLDASHYSLAFWLKIIMPFSGVVMLLLALPFVFGFLRSVNAGQLILIGILLGLVFYILTRIASNIGQIYNLPPFVSATLPIFLVMMVSLMALKKVR